MRAKAYSALSPMTKPLVLWLGTLPPECVQKHQPHCRLPPPDLMLGGAPSSWARAGLVRGGLLGRRMGNGFEVSNPNDWLRTRLVAPEFHCGVPR